MNEKNNRYGTSGAVALLCAAALLSGCSGVKQQLGIGRNSPDEFTVVKRAPLSMPPDYDLRPPMEGMAPPATLASEQAKTALLGHPAAASAAGGGTAESQLLNKMGAAKADPSIRLQINEDNGYLALQNRNLVDRLIFWQDAKTDETRVPASVIDPKKEAERIKKNEAEGKPINQGDVPVIEHKQGALDKIF
jgi:hypothetical protein